MTSPARPRSRDGTCDLIDQGTCQLAGRRNGRPGDPIAAITLIASLTGQAGRTLPELIIQARPPRHLPPDRRRPGHQPPDKPDSATAPGCWAAPDRPTTSDQAINHAT